MTNAGRFPWLVAESRHGVVSINSGHIWNEIFLVDIPLIQLSCCLSRTQQHAASESFRWKSWTCKFEAGLCDVIGGMWPITIFMLIQTDLLTVTYCIQRPYPAQRGHLKWQVRPITGHRHCGTDGAIVAESAWWVSFLLVPKDTCRHPATVKKSTSSWRNSTHNISCSSLHGNTGIKTHHSWDRNESF
jgi:hypothetical protein